jgi:undecaprenyl phosphate-alpha-L-ara4N flippase subunit ArnE
MAAMKQQVIAFALIGAILAAFGQVSFKHGADGRAVLLDFMNLWILLGLVLYFAGTVFWIMALSMVPLTVLYPFAALTYVLVNLFAVTLLGEQLTVKGVAGTGFVLLGLFLVATSFEASHGIK